MSSAMESNKDSPSSPRQARGLVRRLGDGIGVEEKVLVPARRVGRLVRSFGHSVEADERLPFPARRVGSLIRWLGDSVEWDDPVSDREAIDVKEFRSACGQFMTGVNAVTAIDQESVPAALVVNSFTSVSLDPPLVLVCIDRDTNSYKVMSTATRYAVHVLSADQESVSRRFTRSDLSGSEKLDGVSWLPGLGGVPLLSDYIARFECRVIAGYDGGDHVIYLGEVERMEMADVDQPALGYFRGSYYHYPE